MAAKKVVTKAATTKAPAKKPAQQVKKATTVKKSVTKKPVEEVEEEEVVKEKKSLKEKILIGVAVVTGLVGAVALHGRSKYNEGCADQANLDFDKMSKTPTEVNVNLLPGSTNVEAINDADASEDEIIDEDQIEEI